MRRGLAWVGAIDRLSEKLGTWVAWATILMIAIGAFNALARYLNRLGLDLASNAYIEAQWYLFSLVFLLGSAATLREDAHVRVDVIFGRLGPRARAAIDVVGTLLFLFPFCAVAAIVAWPAVESSWKVLEGSPDPGGLPRYPIKTLIPVAFALVFLQGIAQLVRAGRTLLGQPGDAESASPETAPDGERGA